jgi:hypothetical protein
MRMGIGWRRGVVRVRREMQSAMLSMWCVQAFWERDWETPRKREAWNWSWDVRWERSEV